MQPNNPNDPIAGSTPQPPVNPEMPQPLSTTTPQAPTEMPMGEPTPPIPPQGGSLPPQLPNNPQISKAPGKSGKLVMMVIIAVVLIVLGAAAYYFYSTMGKKEEAPAPEPETSDNTEELNGLETELENVEVVDPAGDLEVVDAEITLLEATKSSKLEASPSSR